MVRIYYEALNSMVFVERPAYALIDLCSDFGGMFGIVFGGSVITLVEFMFSLVHLIVYKVSSDKKTIIQWTVWSEKCCKNTTVCEKIHKHMLMHLNSSIVFF